MQQFKNSPIRKTSFKRKKRKVIDILIAQVVLVGSHANLSEISSKNLIDRFIAKSLPAVSMWMAAQ